MSLKPTRRQDIVTAAAEAFRSHGFADTSIQDIAGALGIPKASAYYHIGSKEELFFEILYNGVLGLVERLETIAAYPLSCLDRLRLAVRDNMRSAIEEPHGKIVLMNRDLHVLSPERRAQYRAAERRYERTFLGIIESGIAGGEIRPLSDARVAMFGILAMIGQYARWFKPDGGLSREQVEQIYWDVIVHGLATTVPEPAVPGG